MRERLMVPQTASFEHGYFMVRDRNGIARWTNNPADRDANREVNHGFHINKHRLYNTERTLQSRQFSFIRGAVGGEELGRAARAQFGGDSRSRTSRRGWSRRA